MLKVKNANNYLILLFTIYSLSLCSQSLDGQYCENDKGEKISNCITFFDNNTFIYKGYCRFGDVGSDYGVGHYSINKNSVSLNFDLTSHSYKSYHNIELKNNNTDSININFKVYDINLKKIPFANVIVDKNKEIGKFANEDGIISFKVKKTEIPKLTSISFIGYQSYDFYLKHDVDYSIKVYLDFSKGCDITDEKWNYKIIKKNDEIILKRNNKEYRSSNIDYK